MKNTPSKTSVRRKSSEDSGSTRLTRDDWLDAAFAAVVEGGFDAVRVLSLAEQLKVTRGSFYWHFEDHAQLIDALVSRWWEAERVEHKRLMAIETDDPRADLAQILREALDYAGAKLENMRFELALRGLGRRNTTVADQLAAIDQDRMKLFVEKFMRITQDIMRATDLAALFYLAVVGSYQALARPHSPAVIKDFLQDLIRRYVIEHPKAAPRP